MKETGKKVYFTSDFHYGHRNILLYCNRPFDSISQMNTQLIKNYNSIVEHDAIVYILGDFSFLNTESTKQILKAMKGFKYLIKGNHDRKPNSYYRELGFREVYNKPILYGDKYILSHEPIDENLLNGSKLINIFGHVHERGPSQTKNSYCVCLEKHDYKPVSLSQIEEQVRKYKRDTQPPIWW